MEKIRLVTNNNAIKMEPISYGYDEVNNTQFSLNADYQSTWFLTIPMPIGGIGADVMHKLTEIDKLEYEHNSKDYISKQIKLMQISPERFKVVSWR